MKVLDDITYKIIGAAYEVHSTLGVRLLESAYEQCLTHELELAGLEVECQVKLPLVYKGKKIGTGYRLDLLVENEVIVEIKATDKIHPIHQAQLITYLKLKGKKVGLILNFNVRNMREGGIKRIVI